MRKEQFSICEANGEVYITGKCAMNLHQVSFLHVWSVTLQMLGETEVEKEILGFPKQISFQLNSIRPEPAAMLNFTLFGAELIYHFLYIASIQY